MFEEHAAFDWKALANRDVPPLDRAWFEALVAPGGAPAKAQRALRSIETSVFDQACVVPETTPLAVRLLREALSAEGGAACKAPVDVLHLLGDMAGASARFDALDGFDRRAPGWAHVLADAGCHAVIDAVEEAVPEILPRLAHKTAKVRAAAAYAVAFAAPRSEEVLAALRARLPREKDASAAASMILSLANHLGYAGLAPDELVPWTKDGRAVVAASAAIALARRVTTDAHATAAAGVLLRATERLSSPPTEAAKGGAPAFRFGGGNVDALVLGSLALLAERDVTVRDRLQALLDDDTALGGRDCFTTRTVARVVAAALAGALPPGKVTSPTELAPAARALLEAFAKRPWIWWTNVSAPLNLRGIPDARLPLARWLGLRPPREALLGRAVEARGTIAEVVQAALADRGPLDEVVASLARAAPGEDALDLAEALLAWGQEVVGLPWWPGRPAHDGSVAQIRRHNAEQGGRGTRAALIARGILRVQGEAALPLFRHAARRLGGNMIIHGGAGPAAVLAWLFADELTGGGEPIPEDFWSTAKLLMVHPDLAPAFRTVLARVPVPERILALQAFSNTCGRDGSFAWLYAETVPIASMPSLVENYSMRPDDEVFPRMLDRLRTEGTAADVDRVLAWGVSRFGTPPPQTWSTPEGIFPRAFPKSDGEEVTLYLVPAAT